MLAEQREDIDNPLIWPILSILEASSQSWKVHYLMAELQKSPDRLGSISPSFEKLSSDERDLSDRLPRRSRSEHIVAALATACAYT